MADFLDYVAAFVIGGFLCIFGLAAVILLSPVFWLAVIAFLLVSGN